MPKNIKHIALNKLKRSLFVEKLEYTFLFDGKVNQRIEYFQSKLSKAIVENAICCCFFSEDEWFIITVNEIIFTNNEIIKLREIQDVNLDMKKLRLNRSTSKAEIILHMNNEQKTIIVEFNAWGGILGLLKFLITNKNND